MTALDEKYFDIKMKLESIMDDFVDVCIEDSRNIEDEIDDIIFDVLNNKGIEKKEE